MGGPGSGRRKRVPAATCFEHPGSKVTAEGTLSTASGRRRRYRCVPVVGAPHKFSAPIGIDAETPLPEDLDAPVQLPARAVALWSPPPSCPEHPGSHVVRNGTYGLKTPKRRQRYRCYYDPNDKTRRHSFTPLLPRDHVCEGAEHCGHCEELRGVHRGETAVARRHSWPTRVVVRGLEQLAAGGSYADVGRWARRVTDTMRTRTRPDDGDRAADTGRTSDTHDDAAAAQNVETAAGGKKHRKVSAASKKSRNAWHVAADWVEAFAPVIWEELDQRLRAAALQERARLDALANTGRPLDRPQVVLVDDVPVYGRELDGGKARRDAGFFLCALAEIEWSMPDDPFTIPTSTAKLRLVRAFPKSNTEAWRLVFAELGYAPDFIVADAGTGIAAAIDAHFDPPRTRFIPSIWHVSNAIETALAKVPSAFVAAPAGRRLIDPLDTHQRALHRGSALSSAAAWSKWWDDLDDILKANRLPVEKVRARRAAYEPAFHAVLADLLANPGVPISTGGLETLLAKHVHPMLAMRRTAFSNLERTNLLFDLAVARHHGMFDDHAHLIKLLRSDADNHGGWTVPLRTIADPRPIGGSYSSLRDATLLHTIADDRGLV